MPIYCGRCRAVVELLSPKCPCGESLSGKPWFAEGFRRLSAGDRVQFSTGIDGRMSYGFGHLDNHGFWEHPVPFENLSDQQQEVVLRHDTPEARP